MTFQRPGGYIKHFLKYNPLWRIMDIYKGLKFYFDNPNCRLFGWIP